MIPSQRKAKITWHCRRGMLELDLIFQRFLKRALDVMTEEQLVDFEGLLDYPDPDLYAWLMGYESPACKELVDIVAFIRLHDNT
jgi:antitoxin CptB